ncbi:MAG: hypothetical protein M5U31_02540 [Acidimicrobiia bacterium]|nr:hypothetical protein [Acidimicrobiia bacterium]
MAALGLTVGVTPAGAAAPPSADELTTATLYTAIANSDVLGPVFAHADEIMMSVGAGREIPDGPRREITDEILAEYAALDAQADALVDQIADDVLGFESQGLRQAAADYMGCAEAPVEHEFGSDSGQTSYISMEGTEAVVRITLDKPLCQPLPVELLSFAKIDGKAWPHPQKLHDSDYAILDKAGTTELRVDLPTIPVVAASSEGTASASGDAPTGSNDQFVGTQIGGDVVGAEVCAAQIDLIRDGAVSVLGATLPGLVDAVQTDQPENPACVAGAQVVQASTDPVEVLGIQTIPRTGSETPTLLAIGIALIVTGWLVLTANAAFGYRRRNA